LGRQGELAQVRPERVETIVDTVGAGDAFAAVLLVGLAKQWPLPLTLQRAQTFASAIVGQRGATVADLSFYQAFNWL
jgi:fructokinase